MIRQISAQLLGLNFIIKDATFNPTLPGVFVEYTKGDIRLVPVGIVSSPLTVAVGEILASNGLTVDSTLTVNGILFTNNTDIIGSGSIIGSGDIV
jgi:hypothetical protein